MTPQVVFNVAVLAVLIVGGVLWRRDKRGAQKAMCEPPSEPLPTTPPVQSETATVAALAHEMLAVLRYQVEHPIAPPPAAPQTPLYGDIPIAPHIMSAIELAPEPALYGIDPFDGDPDLDYDYVHLDNVIPPTRRVVLDGVRPGESPFPFASDAIDAGEQ